MFSLSRTETHAYTLTHSFTIDKRNVRSKGHSLTHTLIQPNARTHNEQTDGSNSECKFSVLFFILAGFIR